MPRLASWKKLKLGAEVKSLASYGPEKLVSRFGKPRILPRLPKKKRPSNRKDIAMKLTNPWKKNSEELPPEEETYPPQSARRNFKPVVKYLGASIIGGVVG